MAVLAAVLRSNDADLERWSRELGRCSVSANFQSRGVSLQRDSANDLPSNQSNSSYTSHSSSPVQRQHNEPETDPMSFAQKHRNLTVPRTSSLHAVKSDLNNAIARTIPKHRVTAKEIAASIDASEGTADNLRREVPDAMARLIMLGQAFPDFRTEVARLMGLERDLDPDFQRELAGLLRRVL